MSLGKGECKLQHVEWIDCSCGLPAPYASVLVPDDSDTIIKAFMDGDGKWRDCAYCQLIEDPDVTHWMALPEFPRKDVDHE